MGGVAMLLMIAASGITYGWVPDGGQGVRYIIQIPPDQLDQAKRSGELTSRIPAEIQGHVTEVVIQIGTTDVPRITPPQLGSVSRKSSSSSIATNASADLVPMSIPALDKSQVIAPVISDTATALMKPAPQSGMNFPGGFALPSTAPPSTVAPPSPRDNAQRDANSFELAQRELAAREQAARDQAARDQAARDQAARDQAARDQAARDQLARDQQIRDQATRDQLAREQLARDQQIRDQTARELAQREQAQRDAAASPMNPIRMAQDAMGVNQNPATSNPTTPSTGYTPYSTDDPRTRVNQATATNPATNPFGQALPAFTNENTANSNTAGTQAATANADTSAGWYDMRNASPRRPSTDPVANTNPLSTPFPPTTGNQQTDSGFAGTNFGQMPSGISSNANTTRTTTATWPDNTRSQSLGYDARLTAAQIARLPPGGYSYNAEGYPIDQQGFQLDQYGRRVADQTAAPTTNWANSQANSSQTAMSDPFYRNTPSATVRQPYPDQVATTGATMPSRPYYDEDAATLSASDGQAWGNGAVPSSGKLWPNTDADTRLISSDELNSPPIEQMQMQSVFNALLLLSAVVNFYLFYWLKNLRLQFKEMVTSKRAAANNGLTVNPT